MDENAASAKESKMKCSRFISEYNEHTHTAWTIAEIERYMVFINNRLARKRAEFKQFGKQIDLVIVVDRLLTGFDALRSKHCLSIEI